MENKLNQNVKGMNLDALTSQVGQGEVTWALNANIQSFDGSRYAYTNELGNQVCTEFKPGFIVVGQPYYIIEQDIIIFALHNPDTGESEIGQVTAFNKDCLHLVSKEKDCGCEKGSVLEDEVVEVLEEEIIQRIDCPICRCYQIITAPGDISAVSISYTDCNGVFREPPDDLSTFTPGSVFCAKLELVDGEYVDPVPPRAGVRFEVIRETPLPCPPPIVLKGTCCKYETVVNAPCLNFSEDYPVWFKHKALPCDTYLYFVSKNNPPRRISLSTPKGVDACGKPVPALDCKDIDIFPKTCHPDILPTIIDGNGQIRAGSYRFSLAYTDSDGNELTDYFDLTSEVPVFERPITFDTDYITNKSISMLITHHTDVFDYFNLVVQQTVNTVSTYYLIGTYRVGAPQTYTFTGNNVEEYTSVRILNRSPRYETAGIIEDSDDILFLADLEGDIDYNIQPLANQIKLYWETVEMPADINKFNYHNGIIVSNFRGYMRDEIYGFGIKFKLKTGKYTKIYHIPGRASSGGDLTLLDPATNPDVFSGETNCDPVAKLPLWKVYNTASKFTAPKKCIAVGDPKEKEFSCEIKPYSSQGEFAFWQSTETYPCNKDIWGDLAGEPIRFHKFPDCAITHIHNDVNLSNPRVIPAGGQKIYPIGVRPDSTVLNNLINNFKIYNPKTGDKDLYLKDLICGFELVRTSRFGNKSVIAKGLAYDVCSAFDKTNQKYYYYANYPYNDRNEDYFLSNSEDIYKSTDPTSSIEANLRQKPFDGSSYPPVPAGQPSEMDLRYTFHSPDTHFQFPQLGTELKLEAVENGTWRGRFVPVQEHPRYKFLTRFDFALCSAVGTALSLSTKNESSTVSTLTPAPVPTFLIQTGGSDVNYAEILANTELLKDTLTRLIPEVNYAYTFQSKADYSQATFPTRANQSTRRPLDTAVYLSPNNQRVPLNNGKTEQVNNYQRESSVYLKVNRKFTYAGPGFDNSRQTISQLGICNNPKVDKQGSVKANYMSIKRTIPNQYGTIDNLVYVNTGDFYDLEVDKNSTYVKCKYYPTFGGDIFINRFALKRKMPFFTQNMVGRPDGINFDYQLVPNILYPTYYIGTSPDSLSIQDIFAGGTLGFIGGGLAALLLGQVLPEGNAAKIANTVGYAALSVGGAKLLANLSAAFIPQNNLDCGLENLTDYLTRLLNVKFDLSNPLDPKISVETIFDNLKDLTDNLFYQKGYFYLSSYGIPNFFVESEVNVDMRHGRNPDEENFFPNVGTELSSFGDWLQEYRVKISFDNYYSYNATYSKQNFENFNQPYDSFYPDEICSSVFPNRVIYSDGFTQEEVKDSWLIYRTNNYYDFPKTNGKLIALNQVENNKMLARFENTTQAYNARIIIDSTYPTQLELGTGNMFSTKPIEYVRADLGYVGSQHRAYVSCKYGSFWTDAKRGFIYQLSGSSGFDEITKNNFNWFKRNLPFNIIQDIPNVPIDNSFKDIGIAMVWDERFERVFFTKRDYKLTEFYSKGEGKGKITYKDGKFYVNTGFDILEEISLDDPIYFENKSWTISYSPLTKGWLSFHSFLPNYYVGLTDHFQSGIKTTINGVKQSTLWNHILSPLRYQTYYNKLEPYVIEYSVDTLPNVSTVNSVTLFQDIQKFYNKTDFYSLGSSNSTNRVNFNKAILYNKEQCSGMLYLIPQNPNDMSQRTRYPRIQSDHIEILYSHREQKFTFNSFWDTVNWTSNNQPIFVTDWDILQNSYYIDKVLNPDAIIYQSRQGRQMPLRSTHCRVRLIQDVHSRFRFINTLQNTQINNSII